MHIPVQSGNNAVLKGMRRGYDVATYIHIVEAIRKEIPEMMISTDIIVAFPGETEEAFQDTVKLIEKTCPDMVNISRFAARPGTAAAKMKQIASEEAKRRSRILSHVCKKIALAQNSKWVGWEGEITITEKGKNGTVMGRNYAYKPVVVSKSTIGEKVRVRITDAFASHLRGEII